MTLLGSNPVNARSILLPFVLVLAAAMLAVQLVVVWEGGAPGLFSALLTGAVALGIAAWVRHRYRALLQIRFGLAVVHAAAFAVVTASFNLHALAQIALAASAGNGFETASALFLSTPWVGATLGMSALWGLGLVAHLTGAILGRGWED